MSAEELLPCPFCGGTNTDPEGWMGEHWVSCGTCDASTRMTSTLKTACKAWNRRTPITPSADTGELRERVAREIRDWPFPINQHEGCLELADAILDLIQSERAGSPIGQNDQPGLAFSDAGKP